MRVALGTVDFAHSIEHLCDRPAPAVFAALQGYDPQRTFAVQALFEAREWGRRALYPSAPPVGRPLSALRSFGAAAFSSAPPKSLTIGFLGRFWQPLSPIYVVDAEDLASDKVRGYAKVLWRFDIRPRREQLSTLTWLVQVECPDDDVKRRFAGYWSWAFYPSSVVRHLIARRIVIDARAA